MSILNVNFWNRLKMLSFEPQLQLHYIYLTSTTRGTSLISIRFGGDASCVCSCCCCWRSWMCICGWAGGCACEGQRCVCCWYCWLMLVMDELTVDNETAALVDTVEVVVDAIADTDVAGMIAPAFTVVPPAPSISSLQSWLFWSFARLWLLPALLASNIRWCCWRHWLAFTAAAAIIIAASQ